MIYIKNVLFLLGENRGQLRKIFFFFVLVSILDLIGIGIIGPFLGVVFGGADSLPKVITNFLPISDYKHSELVLILAIVMVLIYSVKTIIGTSIMRAVIKFSQRQQYNLRTKLIYSYQNLDYTKIIKRNSSEYVNTIQLMVPNYANLVMFCLQALGDGIVAIMIVSFLAWTNLHAFSFLVVITAVFLVGFDLLVRKKMSQAGENANISSSLIVRYTNEILRGFKEIRVLKQETYFRENVSQNADIFSNAMTTMNFYSMLPKYIFEMIIIIFIASLSVASTYINEDPMSLVPTLGIFAMASIRMVPLARNFSFTLSRIRYTKDTVIKLANDLKDVDFNFEISQKPEINTDIPIFNEVKTIKLENISYTYPNASLPALKNISIDISEGQHIGIIGSSGAGKTTLVDTILGLLKPSKGRISINGHDVTQHLHSLWDHVAYLPQEAFIIDGSIKQNIALGISDKLIDEAQLKYAIKNAQLDEVVTNLPNGLMTNLGENGVNLSGGQRQRIALARAFYFNRKILVLDEATSSLDTKTEAQIINHLNSLKSKITIISITHRTNSLEYCDNIYTISNGSIF
jgi:ABC-type multidrug transport system fused ATPase/permease subunit